MKPAGSLLSQGVRGFLWIGGGRGIAQVLDIVLRLILAHLLVPADFGEVAMAMTYVGLCLVLGDFGFGAALIQRGELEDRHKDSAFWFTLALAACFALLGLAGAELIASLYGVPEVAPLLQVLSLSLLFNVPYSIYESLLVRDLSFKPVAIRHLAATAIAGGAAVWAAYAGMGAWALVVRYLGSAAVAFAVILGASRWHPSFRFSWSAIRELLQFGSGVSGARVAAAISAQLPSILIGKVLGADVLGLFSIARQSLLVPLRTLVRPLTKVAFPILAKLRHDRDRLRSAYGRVGDGLALVGGVVPALTFALAPLAVPLLAGEHWGGSVFAFRIFSVVAFVRIALSPTSPMLLGEGRSGLFFARALVSLSLYAVALGVGVHYGFEVAVVAFAAAALMAFAFPMVVIAKVSKVPLSVQLGPLFRIAPSVIASCLAAYGCLRLSGSVGATLLASFSERAVDVIALCVCISVGVLVYVAVSLVTARGAWRFLRESLGSLRKK